MYGDEYTPNEGRPFCETCFYESEPCALVYYRDDPTPYAITPTRNETWGDFTVHCHSTDPWRGYFRSKSEKYSLLNTAELLAWHESEGMLKRLDDTIKVLFKGNHIDYARVFARSSNVFYQNYDLYVKNDQELPAKLLVAHAKKLVDYDNPKWYRNIVFDQQALCMLAKLFPEERVETDHDAVGLLDKYGDSMASEIESRLKEKGG